MIIGDFAGVATEHSYLGTGASYVGVYPYQYPSAEATTLINKAQTDTGLSDFWFTAAYRGADFTLRNCAL